MSNLNFMAAPKNGGRDQELREILGKFEATKSGSISQSVILHATSGTGKSALMELFMETVQDSSLLCYSKFEEGGAAAEPFSALIDATSMLISKLAKHENIEILGRKLQNYLGIDTMCLETMLPGIIDLYGVHRRASWVSEASSTVGSFNMENGFGDMTAKEWRFERFRLALRAFFRCVAIESEDPVVLVLDDIHWADPDSLTVIKTLVDDVSVSRKFFFLGVSRPIEESEPSRKLADGSEHVHLMRLSNLDENGVLGIVDSMLVGCPDQDLMPLARLVLEKTSGNAFVVIQFLRMIEGKGLLTFDAGKGGWSWDAEKIVDETNVSETVNGIVVDTLKSAGEEEKRALLVAAAFGLSHFQVHTIVHAIDLVAGDRSPHVDEDALDPRVVQQRVKAMDMVLKEAARNGYVKETAPFQYKFSHDRIREGALSLLPDGKERKRLHLCIGRQLRSFMDNTQELGPNMAFSDEMLSLHATKQLNLGAELISDEWEMKDLADLNYGAAEMAASKASFYPAMEHLKLGINHLGEDCWGQYFDLTHKLKVALARIQYSCGMFSESIATSDEVIQRARVFGEKRSAYHSKVLSLIQMEKQAEATSVVLSVLTELKHPLPRRNLSFHMVPMYFSANKIMRNLDESTLMSLPEVEDESLNDVHTFMLRLSEMAFQGGEELYLMLVAFREIEMVVQNGVCSVAPCFLTYWCCVKALQGDFDSAQQSGWLGMKFAAKYLSEEVIARTKVYYNFLVMPWKAYYHECIPSLWDASDVLFRRNALDMFFLDRRPAFRLCFVAGHSLTDLSEKCRTYSEMLLDYRQTLTWSLSAPLFQAVSNLCGKSEYPAKLTGEYMNVDIQLREWEKSDNKKAILQANFFTVVLCYLFREYDRGLEHVTKWGTLFEEGNTEAPIATRLMFECLIYLSCYKTSRRYGQKREAKRRLRQLQKWSTDGNPNCVVMVKIIEAKMVQVSSKDVECHTGVFDDAIAACRHAGFVHYEAMVNEMTTDYLVDKEQTELPIQYAFRCLDLYSQWGAKAKVDDVRTRFAPIILPPNFFRQTSSGYKFMSHHKRGSAETDQSTVRMLSLSESNGGFAAGLTSEL